MAERVETSSALDLAIDRTQGWCRVWWSRIHHGTTPWLVAVPDIGPSCEVLLADALFHDLRDDEREGLLAWVRSQQHEDGSWRDASGQPDLSLTCLGWWALVQYGADVDSPALDKALRVVHELGGARRANLTVRLWLAMAGIVPWDWVPAVPSELYLLPEYTPLSPARLSPWARQMVTALHLLAEGPARLHLVDAGDLLLYGREGEAVPPRLTSPGLAGDLLQAFDKSIKLARTLPRGAFHRRSLARALRWVDAAQQANGGWFSVRPTLYSLLALRAGGALSDDPRVRRGLDYLRRARGIVEVARPDGEPLRVLAQGLSTRPLAKVARLGMVAGPVPGVPLEGVRERLLANEIARPGPWQLRADAATGGWPLEADADSHLDLRTTCSVIEVLRTTNKSGSATASSSARASLRRAAEVLLAMQEADGSFAWFERGEADVPLSHLPWRDADQLNLGRPDDLGRVTLCAMVLRELAGLGWRREDDRVAKGLAWLERQLAAHGTDWSVATLCEVVRAAVAQCAVDHPLRIKSEALLRARQAEDGSFGDEVATARAILALLDGGGACVQTLRAARFLVARVERLEGTCAARVDCVPCVANVEQPGFGLSPRLRDPSAGVRDIHAALLAFRARGGRIE